MIMAHYIFVTGGVVSSLGKGIATASLGAVRGERSERLMLKLDPTKCGSWNNESSPAW